MGARAYTLIAEVDFQPGEVAVEIGSERGEGSTAYLRQHCAEREVEFFSVDIDPQVEGVIQSDGATWLHGFDRFALLVKFAYLDNFDYVFPSIVGQPWVQDQIEGYLKFQIEMTNENSEQAHLDQAIEVNRLSVPGTMVVIDDTWVEHGVWYGKGATAVPYLQSAGFRVLDGFDGLPPESSCVALQRRT